jgi:hypothetical protein
MEERLEMLMLMLMLMRMRMRIQSGAAGPSLVAWPLRPVHARGVLSA